MDLRRSRLTLFVSIDAEDANLVHVGELGNNKNHESEGVEQQPWMSVICCMRCYQVPAFVFTSLDYLIKTTRKLISIMSDTK